MPMNAVGDDRLALAARRLYEHLNERLRQEPDATQLASTALVVAPHPDDETLGCGGTIIRKACAGASIRVVYTTDGSASHRHLLPADELRTLRTEEALQACATLGLPHEHVAFLGLEDGRLQEHVGACAQALRTHLDAFQPAEVYIPYAGDSHPDHVATRHATLQALHLYGQPVEVLEYPVWFWMHWPWAVWPMGQRTYPAPLYRVLRMLKDTVEAAPGFLRDLHWAVPVHDVLPIKHDALSAHRSQMERLVPTRRWWTLGDVSEGEWLRCFFRDHEVFHRYWYPR